MLGGRADTKRWWSRPKGTTTYVMHLDETLNKYSSRPEKYPVLLFIHTTRAKTRAEANKSYIAFIIVKKIVAT